MSPLRLNGSTSGFSQLDAPAIAGDQTFTLPGTGGTIDRLNRAGNILQVVNATYGTGVDSSSSTYADTGLTASITPLSATSKILVIVNQAGCGKSINNTWMQLKLLRGSTDILIFEVQVGSNGSTASSNVGACSGCILDSPNTTSAVTYKTQFRSVQNLANVTVQAGNCTSTITLMEVAA